MSIVCQVCKCYFFWRTNSIIILFQAQDGQAPQDGQSRIPAAFKSFTISQKEKTLTELVRDQWLSSTSDGKIGLGIRSFLDLRSWFLNNEVVPCHVCNEAAIKV